MHSILEAYDKIGNSWRKINELVDFEKFRETLEECWRPEETDPQKGGRPPWIAILMFKVLLTSYVQKWCSKEERSCRLLHGF